ncbi:MAG TPA: Uma2 family endonuclease [Pirellulales bacterium]|jgi:Uma2 family endonuclease|nr:Uma2 family endonuclease [Pirellulales bacterium]
MSSRTEATVEDLYNVAGKAELIGGEIVMMSPTGGLPGYAALEIGASLREYAQRTRSGHAIGDNVGFVVDLPDRKSFCPDAAYHVGRLSMKFIDGAPVFAVEVRSEGDYGPAAERELDEKRADYFAAGTKVVWDVDLNGPDVVRVYRADDSRLPTTYHRGQLAEAEPAVPGWTMPVDDLFPAEHE